MHELMKLGVILALWWDVNLDPVPVTFKAAEGPALGKD